MKKKLYLAGGISGLTYDEANNWRSEVIRKLMDECQFFNPMDYLEIESKDGVLYPLMPKDEKLMRDFDLHMLRNADVVLVNFNRPNSLGTAQELALAKEWRIPVVGIFEGYKDDLHPWLKLCCAKIVGSVDAAVDFIREFYVMAGY